MRLAVLAVLAACAPAPAPARADPAPASEARAAPDAAPAIDAVDPGCVGDGEPYDRLALLERVRSLASPELDGRASGSAGDDAARAFVAARFRCLGLVPAGERGSYEQPLVADGHPTANVIGYVPGADPDGDIIVVGAHHDHLG